MPVVEIAAFKLVAGADETEFLKASDRVQEEYLSKCRGYVDRKLIKDSEGNWRDVVTFQTSDDAENAAKGFATQPSTKEFEGMIDLKSAKMMHFELTKEY